MSPEVSHSIHDCSRQWVHFCQSPETEDAKERYQLQIVRLYNVRQFFSVKVDEQCWQHACDLSLRALVVAAKVVEVYYAIHRALRGSVHHIL